MDNTRNDLVREDGPAVPGRRQVLKAGAAGVALAAASLLPHNIALAQQARAGQTTNSSKCAALDRRRKLGSIEVSSVGLGVQNMSRTYQTTIPTRSEMLVLNWA